MNSVRFIVSLIVYFFSIFHNIYAVTTQPCPYCKNKRVLTIKEENSLWYQLKDVSSKEEKKFVVVIPSYNNKDWYEKNLDSVFMQVYDNYRVIYIDDASTDETGKLVEDYIKKHTLEEKITLIKNEKNIKALANLYFAIHSCQDDEIIVTLDGDDWFPHDHVLTLLNKVYADSNVWLTYGQFKYFPEPEIGHCKAPSKERIMNNNFRIKGNFKETWKTTWIFSQLRTFYAWLFKKIKIDDLMLDDTFFPTSYDLAIMFPMLEMSGFRNMFVPDVLCVYNLQTPLNDFKLRGQQQCDIGSLILGKEKYKPLKKDFAYETHEIEKKKREEVFTYIFNNAESCWGSAETVSGIGSTIQQTEVLRQQLPLLIKKLNIQTLLDAACGDFNWMKEVNLALKKYIGVDIVPEIITSNKKKYGSDSREFKCLDIVVDNLPTVDLILCKDCFIHLPYCDIKAAIENFKKSGAKYLLTNTYLETKKNNDIAAGSWRALNLQLPPFYLPEPLLLIHVPVIPPQGEHTCKSYGLWKLEDIDVLNNDNAWSLCS